MRESLREAEAILGSLATLRSGLLPSSGPVSSDISAGLGGLGRSVLQGAMRTPELANRGGEESAALPGPFSMQGLDSARLDSERVGFAREAYSISARWCGPSSLDSWGCAHDEM